MTLKKGDIVWYEKHQVIVTVDTVFENGNVHVKISHSGTFGKFIFGTPECPVEKIT